MYLTLTTLSIYVISSLLFARYIHSKKYIKAFITSIIPALILLFSVFIYSPLIIYIVSGGLLGYHIFIYLQKKRYTHFLEKYKLVVFILYVFLVLFWLFQVAVSIAGNKVYPDKDVRIMPKDNTCVHFIPNNGSGEHVNIYSYYCDKTPDWDNLDQSDRDEDKHKKGILDETYTTECPIISVKSFTDSVNALAISQDKLCKEFAHDYPDPLYEEVFVTKDGRFFR